MKLKRRKCGNTSAYPKVLNHEQAKLTDKLRIIKPKISPFIMLAVTSQKCKTIAEDSPKNCNLQYETKKGNNIIKNRVTPLQDEDVHGTHCVKA